MCAFTPMCARVFVCVCFHWGLYYASLKMQLWKQSLNCEGKSEHFANYEARLFIALIVETGRGVEWVYEQTKSWSCYYNSEQSLEPVSLLLVSSQSQSGGCKIMWSQEQRMLTQWIKDPLGTVNRGWLVIWRKGWQLNLIYPWYTIMRHGCIGVIW